MKPRRKEGGRQERQGTHELGDLIADYRRSVDNRDTSYWERQRINYEARYCLWENQTWDGRKWKGRKNSKPFPWMGAADSRVPLVDLLIRQDAAILMQIWREQKILARPTQPAKDAGWANRVTALMRWLLYEEMEESEDEAELLANIYLERGAAALGVWWCKEEQLIRETISLEALVNSAERARQALAAGQRGDALDLQAALPEMILDPAAAADVANLLDAIPGVDRLTTQRKQKILRDLRETGSAFFPRPVVVKDRPMVRALIWNEDVVVPPECVDLQRARHVFVRELLTETDLQSRARSYGYDREWVDQVIETQRGRLTVDPLNHSANRTSGLGRGDTDTSDLFEVVTAHQRLYDEDGIPGIWMTVFAPGVSEKESDVAKRELLDYAHGKYPITLFSLERRSRAIDDSRGYGERAFTWQSQIKRQWDARIDRTDVATLPPSHHPPDEEPDSWGPGVKIPTLQRERFGYFDIPKFDPGSNEVENTVRMFADSYFGRPTKDTDVVEARALRGELVRGWLRGWKLAGTQMLQLCQQYLPDDTWVRVVGNADGRGMRVERAEIQGPFNLVLKFNPNDLDLEFVKEKLELLQKAVTFDLSGRLDRDEALAAVIELIDPTYAERLLKPGEAAALEQVDDEQTILTKLLLGIGVDVRGDEAFGLRRQVLLQTVQQSPTAQEILKANPTALELVQRRIQQLDFNIQQKTVNPDIGRRLGSKPMSAANPATSPTDA